MQIKTICIVLTRSVYLQVKEYFERAYSQRIGIQVRDDSWLWNKIFGTEESLLKHINIFMFDFLTETQVKDNITKLSVGIDQPLLGYYNDDSRDKVLFGVNQKGKYFSCPLDYKMRMCTYSSSGRKEILKMIEYMALKKLIKSEMKFKELSRKKTDDLF